MRRLYAVPVTLHFRAKNENEAAAYAESMLDFFIRASRDAASLDVYEVHSNLGDVVRVKETQAKK